MLDDVTEFAKTILLPFIVFFAVIGGCSDQYLRYQCRNYEKASGLPTKVYMLDACYVQTAHGWQRWDEYKARAVASEGLAK